MSSVPARRERPRRTRAPGRVLPLLCHGRDRRRGRYRGTCAVPRHDAGWGYRRLQSGPRRVNAAEGAREQALRAHFAVREQGRAVGSTDAPPVAVLLDLDFGALLFEGGDDLVSLVARNALLDRLRRGVDGVLGLLEARAGRLADDLDDRDLVRADLGQDRAELGLLLGRGGRSARVTAAAAGAAATATGAAAVTP